MNTPLRTLLPLLFLCCTLAAYSQSANQNPQDMFNHVLWQAYGSHEGEQWSYYGLNYLGRLNDSVPHAITIGCRYNGQTVSNLVLNLSPFDTVAVHRFLGSQVIPARFNDDSYQDYVVVDYSDPFMYVFFGTSKLDSFVTKLVFARPLNYFNDAIYAVIDCDQDGYSDLLFADMYATDSLGRQVGAMYFIKGGPDMTTAATEVLKGTPESPVGGLPLLVGKFRDTSTQYLACVRMKSVDSVQVFLSPFGSSFHLAAIDTLTFVIDTSKFDVLRGATNYFALDLDGSGISSFLVQSFDTKRYAQNLNGGLVLGYRCGMKPDTQPSFLFHSPFPTTVNFGFKIIDVGNACSSAYHSILISDDEDDARNLESGAVYLYNIGKGYKDSCVAFANDNNGGFFGEQVIAVSDLNNDGYGDWIVGSKDDKDVFTSPSNGRMVVFLGNQSYATPTNDVSQRTPENAALASLSCYPNPVSRILHLQYNAGNKQDVQVEICDLLGRVVTVVNAPGGETLWRITVDDLPSGTYCCRVRAGNITSSRIIVRR